MNNLFFERPILNSPYDYPKRYGELDDQGQYAGCASRTISMPLVESVRGAHPTCFINMTIEDATPHRSQSKGAVPYIAP
jgi:hypothetical protein